MTNLIVLMLLAAAQSAPGPGVGERLAQDRGNAATPVTGMFLIPPKIPDCRTKEEADAAVEAKRAGEWEKCDPERYIRAHGS